MAIRGLKQKCCYWAGPTSDGRGGHSYTAAVQLSCRWQNKAEMFFSPEGREEVSRAVVYLDQDVDLGGFMFLGKLTELPDDSSDPRDVTGAFKIRAVGSSPSLNGRTTLYKVYL